MLVSVMKKEKYAYGNKILVVLFNVVNSIKKNHVMLLIDVFGVLIKINV